MRVWRQEGKYPEELLFALGYQRPWPIWGKLKRGTGANGFALHGRPSKTHSEVLKIQTKLSISMGGNYRGMKLVSKMTATLSRREKIEIIAVIKTRMMRRTGTVKWLRLWQRTNAMIEMKHEQSRAARK